MKKLSNIGKFMISARKLREKYGYSYEELQKKTGIHAHAIRAMEEKCGLLSWNQLVLLAHLYDRQLSIKFKKNKKTVKRRACT